MRRVALARRRAMRARDAFPLLLAVSAGSPYSHDSINGRAVDRR